MYEGRPASGHHQTALHEQVDRWEVQEVLIALALDGADLVRVAIRDKFVEPHHEVPPNPHEEDHVQAPPIATLPGQLASQTSEMRDPLALPQQLSSGLWVLVTDLVEGPLAGLAGC